MVTTATDIGEIAPLVVFLARRRIRSAQHSFFHRHFNLSLLQNPR
jgi:hypothetical protein